MVKQIVRDVFFLGQPSEPATKADIQVGTLRTSFAAVEPLLCAYPCFCGICRGVVVNFHEVAGRQEDVFLLKDGTRLPISRRRLREVQEAYSAFRFDRLRKDGVD